ncbi:MAG: L-glutamate gamma-semialdehyde dehydrogenase [Chitinophagales bacterium]|jgi:1-pyrroline-5-carboxylate dehydrogenase|nr:L-glutamate gamma-semialdehyde dehydrogenase [Chitinophagales bacterium]
MANGFFRVPNAVNEPVKQYEKSSPDRAALLSALADLKSKTVEIPMFIGSEEVFTQEKNTLHPPHERMHILGYAAKGEKAHVSQAIDAALAAKENWSNMAWENRLAIFMKSAELLRTKYRWTVLAATMLAQSKNAFQAEIDAACELIDFLNFNVQFAAEIYQEQPISPQGVWNRMEYRALEGFVLAVTPFNFTAIAGNLPTSAAMMGNTVVWKCANSQIYSAYFLMKLFKEAGLPDGVINLIYSDGKDVGEICFAHRDFAGVHFTGSTGVFNSMWTSIGANIHKYKSYPRIVGETGGKDFVFAHPNCDIKAVSVALSRGAFEYQGQKCSAASRAYIPESIWAEVREHLLTDLKSFKMGKVDDMGNFINAVIDQKSFDSIKNYIEFAKSDADAEILIGGECDDTQGFFVSPTVILTTNPKFKTMCEEIFGPVLTIYVYPDAQWKQTASLLNETSDYALTGAIFSQDRQVIQELSKIFQDSAGNFYINDKPTGAVVGQQPFGGGRKSGTNDKAGSKWNLLRWVNLRTIKETLNPPTDYRYPFLEN